MRTTAILVLGLAALVGLFQAAPGLAQKVKHQVSFPAGSDGTTRTGAITGDEAVRSVLGARAGQRMTVKMTTTNASASFNITAPGATKALQIGSVAENSFNGILPVGGTYAVEVSLCAMPPGAAKRPLSPSRSKSLVQALRAKFSPISQMA